MAFGGGRIVASETSSGITYTPHYYLTDHLGSTRVVVDGSNGEVLERNDYYAFGERWNVSGGEISDNRYRYNGKELQTTGDLPYTDYGARMYSGRLGRWSGSDPLAEKYYSHSPYAFCGNNPIVRIDTNGAVWDIVWDVGNIIYDVASAVYNHTKGDHEAAKSNWADAGTDVVAAIIPFFPAGISKVDNVIDAVKAVDKTVDATKISRAGKYTSIGDSKSVGDGKRFTSSQKQKILDQNRKQNGGQLKSDLSGKQLDDPQKMQKGVKVNKNQAEVDHVQPKSKGGSNSSSNAQVLSKEENLKKGNR